MCSRDAEASLHSQQVKGSIKGKTVPAFVCQGRVALGAQEFGRQTVICGSCAGVVALKVLMALSEEHICL